MKDIEQERESEWKRRGQEMICLFFILLGMCLCMENILGIPVSGRSRFLSVIALVFVSEFLARSFKRTLAGTAVFLGGLLFFCMRNQELLQTALKEMANRILELINHYQGTDFLYWHLPEASKGSAWIILLIAFLVLGAVESVLLLNSKDRVWHLRLAFVLPVLIVTAGLMVGKTVSLVGILLMTAGILAETLDIRQKGLALLAAGIALSLGIAVLISGNQNLWKQIEVWHEDWQDRQLALENRMLEIVDQIWDISLFSKGEKKEYLLTNEKPATAGRKVFKITVDAPVSENIYIRGFTGGEYGNGKWKIISRQEFSDWAQRQGGSEQEYARMIQSAPYEFLEYCRQMVPGPLANRSRVSIEMEEEGQGYALTPYFTKLPEDQSVKADGMIPGKGGRAFSWNSYLRLSDMQVQIAEMARLEGMLTELNRTKNDEVWEAYEEYARETYTRLPAEGLQRMRNYARQKREEEEARGFELYAAQMIQETLWENARYSFDLQPTPEGADYAEYFLFTQQKGYCVHFATAATLLFRMNDIPARFVSGYLVLPSDFKENKDGTWSAEITDDRAHAWTEVFDRNIGFYPVEVTPPSYRELLEGLEEGEHVVQAVEKKEEEEFGEEENSDTGMPEKQSDSEEKQKEAKKDHNKNVSGAFGTAAGQEDSARVWLLLRFCLFLGSSFVVCILFFCYRKWALKKRQRRISQKDRTQAVREIAKELNRILSRKGYGHKGERNDRQYQQMLEKELPEFPWEQAVCIFQKAAFSQSGVTEEEYQTVRGLYYALKER